MRIIPSFKKCTSCDRELTVDEFYYSESIGNHVQPCRDCTRDRERLRRNAKGTKSRNRLVKSTWLDSTITLSNRVIKANDIKEADTKQIIDEGFGFVLRGFDKNNGKSVF